MRRFAAVLAVLALGGTMIASGAEAKKVKLVRHEDQNWTWYGPPGWVAASGFAGIDISSPTGVLHVGFGFSGSAYPVTNAELRDFLVQSGGLDVHPLANVAFTSLGTPFPYGDYLREIDRYRAVRTDRHQKTRGLLTTDVLVSGGAYGFESSVINAPKKLWKSQKRLLVRLRNLIFYHPH